LNNHSDLGVVFDVNVYLNVFLAQDKEGFPLLPKVPPKTGNPSQDCLSLAFDAEKFNLFTSPHIIENVAKVLHEKELEEVTIGRILETLVEITHLSGGSVVVPPRLAFDSADFEDNLILDLVKYTDSKVLVTSDRGLLSLNPWNHRLILSPMDFLEHIL
jgi:putative PIN family toxin of toxin-antitoxin system